MFQRKIYSKLLTWKRESDGKTALLIEGVRQNKICPIEVKSCGYNTHKSLDAFSEKYSGRILEKYQVYTKDLKKDADILMLPVYMLPFLKS